MDRSLKVYAKCFFVFTLLFVVSFGLFGQVAHAQLLNPQPPSWTWPPCSTWSGTNGGSCNYPYPGSGCQGSVSTVYCPICDSYQGYTNDCPNPGGNLCNDGSGGANICQKDGGGCGCVKTWSGNQCTDPDDACYGEATCCNGSSCNNNGICDANETTSSCPQGCQVGPQFRFDVNNSQTINYGGTAAYQIHVYNDSSKNSLNYNITYSGLPSSASISWGWSGQSYALSSTDGDNSDTISLMTVGGPIMPGTYNLTITVTGTTNGISVPQTKSAVLIVSPANFAQCNGLWHNAPLSAASPVQPVGLYTTVSGNQNTVNLVWTGTDNAVYQLGCRFFGGSSCAWDSSVFKIVPNANYSAPFWTTTSAPNIYQDTSFKVAFLNSGDGKRYYNYIYSSYDGFYVWLTPDNSGATGYGTPTNTTDSQGKPWNFQRLSDNTVQYECGVPLTPTGFWAGAGTCGTGQINLSWSASYGATSYTVKDGARTVYSGSALAVSDTGLVAGSNHTYTITATDASGTSASGPTTPATTVAPSSCTPVPVTTFTASPTSGPAPLSTTLSWSATNGATGCTASSNPVNANWNGAKTLAQSPQTISGLAAGSYTFSLYCTNATGNSTTVSPVVTVGPALPTITSFVANPLTGTSPLSTTLTWASSGATSCTASGGWSGSKATSNAIGEVVSGLTVPTTFNLVCTNASGNSPQSQVIVTPTAPNYTLTVSVTTSQGGYVTGAGIDCGSSGHPTCTATYPQGTPVILTPTPVGNWKFIGWTGACTGSGACSFNVNSNLSVTALFVPRPINYQEF